MMKIKKPSRDEVGNAIDEFVYGYDIVCPEPRHIGSADECASVIRSYIAAVDDENNRLRDAAAKVIKMNRQHAEDQYGDSEKAEGWACVVALREALAQTEKEGE